MINQNLKVTKESSPFPYVKIQDFLEDKFFKELELNFPKSEEFTPNDRTVKRMDFDTSYGDNLYNNLILKNECYKKFHDYIYSKKFINFFLNIFKKEIEKETQNGEFLEDIDSMLLKPSPHEVGGVKGKNQLNNIDEKFVYPRLDIGLGVEGYGKNNGGGGIHIDNPQRIISLLFYLGGYDHIEGGDHRIWKMNKNKDDLEVYETIKPKKNLLIAGLQNNFAFHDVKPVQKINGSRNAFYMAVSSSVPVWKNVKNDNFNIKYNKNRVRLNFIQKLRKKFL